MTGEIALPASQVVTPEFYSHTTEYTTGEMAISEHDMATYKCIDTADPAEGCWNDSPFNNTYWQQVTFKPPVDTATTTVWTDFAAQYRYILADHLAKVELNTVYQCYAETFCQLDPLAPYGENGWGLT